MFIKGVCLDGCPETLNPVCGENESGFRNNCILERASAALGEGQSIKKVHNGPCASKNDNFFNIFFLTLIFLFQIIHTFSALPSESHKQKAELEVLCISHP